MKALIDLDPIPYAYGGLTFEDGSLMPDNLLQRKVDEKIKRIVERSGAEDWVGYITNSPSNFRNDVATILPYKGNRAGAEKPAKWGFLRYYLLSEYSDKVKEISGYEADDQLSIDQCTAEAAQLEPGNTIICTIDKDLMMVPGWHYNWQHDEKSFVTEIEGLRFFYQQLLTGDSCDNIKGLYGVGPKSTLIKKLNEFDTEEDMFNHVFKAYEDRFGSYAKQFIIENGRLLWMMRNEDDDWAEVAEDYVHIKHLKEKEDDNT